MRGHVAGNQATLYAAGGDWLIYIAMEPKVLVRFQDRALLERYVEAMYGKITWTEKFGTGL